MSSRNERPAEQSLTKADYEQLAGFRYTLRMFLRGSEVRARRAGITIQQYLALLAIKGFPERDQINVKELAERLQIKHHSAVGLVDRMEKSGLVARRPGSGDRRTVHITLTPAGEAQLQRLATDNIAQLKDVEPHIRALFSDGSP